ncbi:glycosyl-transferase for dystroglycan-domain-containing protein [Cokeromyces recurvatus]|uniref:glycosyl-transferase for dystroglycan-domain-containing protein n=1 Tax=Cokeromyces recurvatus TaxID=90255 RepID=UPI00221E4D8F|nr:glycosyl-transferase for dystroglycan-domain-containing protein [Cokeromyces recurvatus]KAI7905861.1 glycosyl-transferase for dystroglycan-domain-containing protein [Cokeromyces recurvatus]
MMSDILPKSVGRYIKYIIFTYAMISLVYTAVRFYNISGNLHTRARRSIEDSLNPVEETFFVAPFADEIMEEDEELKSIVYFDDQMTSVLDNEPEPVNTLNTVNSVLQSKTFSGAMGPSEITPYYIKATENFNTEDISISTIVTNDRFPILSRLATKYQGPISAAIHINDDEKKKAVLAELDELFEENPYMKRYVDVHLIVDKYDRQFNMWRNVAKLYARTDYIMMLDIDFYLCTDFRKVILENPDLMAMLNEGHTAFVIPAFEYIAQSDGFDYTHFPKSKDELLKEVFEDEKLDMFHRSWERGHSSTNYHKWYTATEPYRVEEYNFSYEPYIVFKRQTSPWCDERFIGYGANKAACLYEIYISGIDFYVLPNDFIIHQSHAYPEAARKRERTFNRKVYTNFREELCLRYARQFIANGDWNISISNNLRTECMKIREFSNVIQAIDQ